MSHTPKQLPVSVQFMGRHGGERTLLDIAFTLEANHPWPLLCDYNREAVAGGEHEVKAALTHSV
jgi:amidase